MVYSFLSGKGSQGKTVCAFNTIITWLKSNKGKTALALDIDHKQASMARLREFREKRELEPMFDYMAIADGKSLEAQLPRLSEQYDLGDHQRDRCLGYAAQALRRRSIWLLLDW